DVDVDAIRAAVHSAPRHVLTIDDSIPAGDLLADYALITGTVVATTKAGLLTLIPLAESVSDSVMTLSASDLK
ncbi:hypothetical protein, partial [Pseudomonas sp. SZ57]|uniref:hypothetical protein n=1 Tax=Pseudomonas sp. SZ57 TaxID=2662259 RepID=UPI0015B549D0